MAQPRDRRTPTPPESKPAAARHDKWFAAEVEAAVRQADSPAAEWQDWDELKQDWVARDWSQAKPGR